MLDRIALREMLFYGRHGVHPEEAQLGQRFEVDLELYLDTSHAGETDSLADTVDYGQVYETIRSIVEGQRFALIEALAAALARAVLSQYCVEAVTVRVRKPQAPIKGISGGAEVDIHRKRDWLEVQDAQ